MPGGNIPAGHAAIELKLTFKEGGAPDFHSNFERIKERLQQAVEVARDSVASRQENGLYDGVNMDAVHLDQLPTYEASRQDRVASSEVADGAATAQQNLMDAPVPPTGRVRENNSASNNTQPPSDAPPDYEEAQQQSIQQELDRRLSG